MKITEIIESREYHLPESGDTFSIDTQDECLVESYVISVTEDTIVIAGDEQTFDLLSEHGLTLESIDESIEEAKYQGRTVTLNKPMQGDVKKSKVYVKDPKTGNVKKVNFGKKGMNIKKNNPARRKSFRARHKCATAKDKTTPRYWSCRAW